ncbi:patatin-like phospholipase family protein [Teredinibacter waterburyi]|uniref:patatin-like phospholipase family protein n=1 Tax=Teredinibacter waterburyi TaxID=1500538 RepID=UPI00165F4909|nr:patatin-like phospholipase family protein [Teredinibacter waterburyi]
MENSRSDISFNGEVFNAELDEIKLRRKQAFPLLAPNSIDAKIESVPTIRNELVGLACSGGGIRSASFSLGIIQHLIQKNLLGKVDYLSTVSGGGYIGSCLSGLVKDYDSNAKLLVTRADDAEPQGLNHIRNYSEYLGCGGLLNSMRIPVLFLEGILRSFFMFLPLIILAVLATEVFFEATGRLSDVFQRWIPLLGLLPLALSLAVRPIFKRHLNWRGRDAADTRVILYTVLAITALVSIPLFEFLRSIVSLSAVGLMQEVAVWAGKHMLAITTGFIVTLITLGVGLFKAKDKVLVLILGVSAPAVLFMFYTLLCVEAINSPFSFHTASRGATVSTPVSYIVDTILETTAPRDLNLDCSDVTAIAGAEMDAFTPSENFESNICSALRIFLMQKNIGLETYRIATLDKSGLVLTHKQPQPSSIVTWLTTQERNRYDITVVSEFGGDSALLQIRQLMLSHGNAEWWLYLLGLAVLIYNFLFVNINRFSLHPFYRDRLSRTFLFKPMAGDKTDGNCEGAVAPADEIKMSELNQATSSAPYHIINTALNLQGSHNPQLRSRKSVPFILAKRYCGSDYTGYCATADMEAQDPHFNLGTAMAISAAAASPNMGAVTVKPLSFFLTLMNIRLNYWLPHPKIVAQGKALRVRYNSLGLRYLLREALGLVSERTAFVNCSDGGHIENLGVYELLKRQCKTIVCIDAEADPSFTFNGLITLQRYAEIDLGAKIEIDLSEIKPVEGLSKSHYSLGSIHYNNGETGRLLYLKLSVTGTEPEYLHYYRAQNPTFPHQSTADQYFDETQFEVYRALGSHVAEAAADDMQHLLTS